MKNDEQIYVGTRTRSTCCVDNIPGWSLGTRVGTKHFKTNGCQNEVPSLPLVTVVSGKLTYMSLIIYCQ